MHLAERYQRAKEIEALYQHAVSIKEQQLGATHPRVQTLKNAFAVFLHSIGPGAEVDVLEVTDEPTDKA